LAAGIRCGRRLMAAAIYATRFEALFGDSSAAGSEPAPAFTNSLAQPLISENQLASPYGVQKPRHRGLSCGVASDLVGCAGMITGRVLVACLHRAAMHLPVPGSDAAQ
jgi:hypothetical protein